MSFHVKPPQTEVKALAITKFCIYFASHLILKEALQEGQLNKIFIINSLEQNYSNILPYVNISANLTNLQNLIAKVEQKMADFVDNLTKERIALTQLQRLLNIRRTELTEIRRYYEQGNRQLDF